MELNIIHRNNTENNNYTNNERKHFINEYDEEYNDITYNNEINLLVYFLWLLCIVF